MLYPARALASIVNERQDGWRSEVNDDRRFASAQARTSRGPRFRLPVIRRRTVADIRHRTPGASAEA